LVPYFAQEINTPDGKSLYHKNTQKVRQPIKKSTADAMRQILSTAVAEGSGRKSQVSGFPVGGKTGTAQKYKDGVITPGKYVSSFVGFAPADNPKYVALLSVDEPQGYLYYGSLTAAPYVGKVFEQIARNLGIPAHTLDSPEITMPNLLGLNFLQAEKALKELGFIFEMSGDGDEVVGTVPSFGSKLPKGDVVLVRLG
ncbi:MAG: PASTA domain-containing protein, partial [Clostridiales bacterium]|nr:PASTA domain-containing protein [Clostridiales bacterium]